MNYAFLFQGFLLGWSVAWPPGPINAEMLRRGLLPKVEGGGFWPAWRIGLGACAGDSLWALGVSLGAGALINTPKVRVVLGIISLLLLLFLASVFLRGAWRAWRERNANGKPADNGIPGKKRGLPGFLLGFTLALTSPWNIGFWLAVIGSQSGRLSGSLLSSLLLAGSVLLGAITWGFAFATAIKLGARIFSRPSWQIATQALTALVMLYFAAQLVVRLLR
ncbi:MAG: LysE family transporter [Chthoniobacterales bacterium]